MVCYSQTITLQISMCFVFLHMSTDVVDGMCLVSVQSANRCFLLLRCNHSVGEALLLVSAVLGNY